jgi:glycosyltransferase involved in cell wall biosynthesis
MRGNVSSKPALSIGGSNLTHRNKRPRKLPGLVQFALWAQRHRWPVPRFVRRAGRTLLSQFYEDEVQVEDWSRPLIARRVTPRVEMPSISNGSALQSHFFKSEKSQARLRCLILTSVLDAGGIDEFVAFLARRLPTQGVDINVMLTDPASRGGRLITALRREGIQIIDESPDESCQWLATQRPDVISAHAPPDWILKTAHILHIPVVETLHAVPTPIGTDWRQEGPRSRNIKFFIAVSDLVRRQYLHGNPTFDAQAVLTIPNGFNDTHRPDVDRAKARAWLGLEDEFLFISLGRYVFQKNAYGLMAAFEEIAHTFPQAHLLIAGRMDDPSYMKQLWLLRSQMREPQRIHLRDNLPNPSALFSAADGFVMNSFFEGWPLASMEALCSGLPVVISDVGGAREQVGLDGKHGYIVPNPAGNSELASWESAARERFRHQTNKDALVRAMNSLIINRKHWEGIRPALAEEAKLRFSADICLARYAETLERATVS